jgi:DNA-binding NarL/FixJ family response regulator
MGLGLSICHTIVTDHNGRLWAEPSPDGVTIFTWFCRSRPATLTPIKQKVMERRVDGKEKKQIADSLGISVGAVAIHWVRVLEEMRSKPRRPGLYGGRRRSRATCLMRSVPGFPRGGPVTWQYQ